MSKLLIAVTFYFAEERLKYLDTISRSFMELADEVVVFVITNASNTAARDKIMTCLDGKGFIYHVVTPNLLGHPYLLTWFHLDILRCHAGDESITHFMYLEDDIHIKKPNIDYWLRARQELRPFDLIPSFLRYEINEKDNQFYLTDIQKTMNYYRLPKVTHSRNYAYLNAPNPYQGMYLLDRDLLHEHLANEELKPDYGSWGIRETAAQGLTFCHVPKGYRSRNLFGFHLAGNRIDYDCLVHHVPNNYANDPDTTYGKIKVNKAVVRIF